MFLINDYKNVLLTVLHPFANTKKAMSIKKGAIYFWKGAFIPMFLLVLTSLYFFASMIPNLWIRLFTSAAAAVIAFVLAPVVMLLIGAYLHLLGKLLFGFKGNFSSTYSGVVYGITATTGLTWPLIPIVIIIGSVVGSFVVMPIAIANQNKVSSWKALGTLLVSLVLIIIPYVVIVRVF